MYKTLHKKQGSVTVQLRFARSSVTFCAKRDTYADNDNQILRVNMAHIRRKLEENPAEPQYIFTEIGVGYRMREE